MRAGLSWPSLLPEATRQQKWRTRSTLRGSRGTFTPPTYPIQTSLSAQVASRAFRGSCSGSPPTPRSLSWTPTGRRSAALTCSEPCATTRADNAVLARRACAASVSRVEPASVAAEDKVGPGRAPTRPSGCGPPPPWFAWAVRRLAAAGQRCRRHRPAPGSDDGCRSVCRARGAGAVWRPRGARQGRRPRAPGEDQREGSFDPSESYGFTPK